MHKKFLTKGNLDKTWSCDTVFLKKQSQINEG